MAENKKPKHSWSKIKSLIQNIPESKKVETEASFKMFF